MTNSETATSLPSLELRGGLDARMIDGHLRRATRGLDISNRIMAFYFDEMAESGKFRDLGYRCLAQYADQSLAFDPRRARELCQAGRVLMILTEIDRACREGQLCWTKTELLTHGVREHEQGEWLERAMAASCSELKAMLARHRKGLTPDREGSQNGGLPQSEIDMQGSFPSKLAEKIEAVRSHLMRRRGRAVDDSEVLNHIVEKHVLPEYDEKKAAARAAACEQKETPAWLRDDVLARDRYTCQACGRTEHLHAHHIVFRSEGGLTHEANMVVVCTSCHGLIHEGRLFAKREGPTHVEFRNRFGELLRGWSKPAVGLPQGFLELLRPEKSGGRPPRSTSVRSSARRVRPQSLTLEEIPEEPTAKWFLDHMHLLDCSSKGVWRIRKSSRR